ncbi:MAG: Thymidylate kinase [Chlamydiales bacterium]|nr:Thymidylate kinase [Chlamydiales bacterium]
MQQMNKPYEGLFVTIEGGDGCGKSTLSERLEQQLQKKGYSVFKTREPGGTELSEKIRDILLNPNLHLEITDKAELLLFLAARAQHVEKKIKPALHQGQIVICERFNDSSIAYQGCARHLGMHYVEQLCELVFEKPDITLFLDLDPEEGLNRMKTKRKEPIDRLEQEQLQFHKEVRQGYLHLADAHPNRISVLDASKPIEFVLQSAMEVLEPRLMLRPTT